MSTAHSKPLNTTSLDVLARVSPDAFVPPGFFFAGPVSTVALDRAQWVSDARVGDLDEDLASRGARRGHWWMGALPFDRDERCRLLGSSLAFRFASWTPKQACRERGPESSGACPPVAHVQTTGFEESARRAIEAIRAGELEKVVLARQNQWEWRGRLNWRKALADFRIGQPNSSAYAMRLRDDGRVGLIGSSPELLLKKRGQHVSCLPLAGSRPRGAERSADLEARRELRHSDKDHAEHRLLVEQLKTELSRYTQDIEHPERPELTSTATMWHLATPLKARLADPHTDVLDLVQRIYPTAAVCGVPRSEALSFIRQTEPFDRGFYGGAIGYMDPNGDGEWVVTIRGAEVRQSEHPTVLTARALAGAGIVRESDAEQEGRETVDKAQSVFRTLSASIHPGEE